MFDSRTNTGTGSSSSEAASTPSMCPACQSSAITTTAKSPDVNTYWRCQKCGEVWNVSRRESRRYGGHTWR